MRVEVLPGRWGRGTRSLTPHIAAARPRKREFTFMKCGGPVFRVFTSSWLEYPGQVP